MAQADGVRLALAQRDIEALQDDMAALRGDIHALRGDLAAARLQCAQCIPCVELLRADVERLKNRTAAWDVLNTMAAAAAFVAGLVKGP